MAMPSPWNLIEADIGKLQDYAAGARKLADFFKGFEEKHDSQSLMHMVLASNPHPKWWERLLFSMCDVAASDKQVGARALEGRRMRRLMMRCMSGSTLGPTELILAERLQMMFEPMGPAGLNDALNRARHFFAAGLGGQELAPEARQFLVLLVRTEAECLKERVDWLSENADPYNMKTMARILPRLRIYDEGVHEGLSLANKLEAGSVIGAPMLSFENEMKTPVYEKWIKEIGKSPRLPKLVQLLSLQRERKVATLDLIALSTLSRWIHEIKGQKLEPIDYILLALKSVQGESFVMEGGDLAKTLTPLLSQAGIRTLGTRFEGRFVDGSFPDLIGKDLLTRPLDKTEEAGLLDVKALVAQNITRDGILEALLNNPKINQTPGMVAYVVQMCRSVPVLSKIAKRRELYSGFANRDVPLALLYSPCNIPINLLRPFISAKFVSFVDLRGILKQRGGIRREIQKEVEEYLKGR